MNFTIERTCKDCGNIDRYDVSKIEAAFSTREKLIENKHCNECKSSYWSSIKYPKPEIDREVLDVWGSDQKLYFMNQDEDIILAEEENIALFLEAIDSKCYPKPKLNILITSICILAYDNIVDPEEYTFEENKQRKIIADKTIKEIIKRKHLLTDLNWEVMDYVKDIVFPRLDIKA